MCHVGLQGEPPDLPHEAVLHGDLDEFTDTLQAEERRARLEAQASGA